VHQRIKGYTTMRYTNRRFYLLTYFLSVLTARGVPSECSTISSFVFELDHSSSLTSIYTLLCT